jgi:hypothetical protein
MLKGHGKVKKEMTSQPISSDTKKCQYCGLEIKVDAIVCEHCGRGQAASAPTTTPTRKKGNPALGCLGLFGMVASMIWCLASFRLDGLPTVPLLLFVVSAILFIVWLATGRMRILG